MVLGSGAPCWAPEGPVLCSLWWAVNGSFIRKVSLSFSFAHGIFDLFYSVKGTSAIATLDVLNHGPCPAPLVQTLCEVAWVSGVPPLPSMSCMILDKDTAHPNSLAPHLKIEQNDYDLLGTLPFLCD